VIRFYRCTPGCQNGVLEGHLGSCFNFVPFSSLHAAVGDIGRIGVGAGVG